MAHPYASQAKSSEKARLARLTGKPGKSWGSSKMYKASSYPTKGAGVQREYTIPSGGAKRRVDRMAGGGFVGGGGKKKRHAGNTTNIIISHAGGRGGSGGGGGAGPNPTPVPVPRPVPVPVGGGAGPAPAGGPALPMGAPPRPPMPMAGPGGPPPGGPVPPMRPPGMKAGGAVRRAANGGFLKEGEPKGYRGFPHSPTTSVDSAVSAHKKGGSIKKADGGGVDDEDTSAVDSAGVSGYARGGKVKKRQMGGTLGGGGDRVAGGLTGVLGNIPGRHPLPAQQAAPTISGANALPPQPVTVPMPATLGAFASRPAPGTTPTFSKKGGSIKRQNGGTAGPSGPEERSAGLRQLGSAMGRETSFRPGEARPFANQRTSAANVSRTVRPGLSEERGGYKKGGAVHDDEAEDRKLFGKMMKAKGLKGGGKVRPGEASKARGLAGSTYHQQGKGFKDGGGITNATGGASGGKGRLAMTRRAKSVPDKTEV